MKILIDPGHSGPSETGACACDVSEAAIVLAIARLAAARLRERGHTVRLSRDGDIDDDGLTWRAELANEWGADLFLSIHANSAADPAAHGTEVWHYPGSRAGRRLAHRIQRSIVRRLGTADRGVKSAAFTVLAATECPAVLIETAFLSNLADRTLLTTSARQADFAVAIAAAIGALN
jgi:N-acetylmuramoyl-L-alanine amidase